MRPFSRSLEAAAVGLHYAWRTQPHLRFEAGVALAAVTLALLLGTGLVAVLLASTLVLVAELLNTAIEALVDLVTPEHRPLAAAAKDAAAGAVLVAAAFAVAVGLAALGPALWSRLSAWVAA